MPPSELCSPLPKSTPTELGLQAIPDDQTLPPEDLNQQAPDPIQLLFSVQFLLPDSALHQPLTALYQLPNNVLHQRLNVLHQLFKDQLQLFPDHRQLSLYSQKIHTTAVIVDTRETTTGILILLLNGRHVPQTGVEEEGGIVAAAEVAAVSEAAVTAVAVVQIEENRGGGGNVSQEVDLQEEAPCRQKHI